MYTTHTSVIKNKGSKTPRAILGGKTKRSSGKLRDPKAPPKPDLEMVTANTASPAMTQKNTGEDTKISKPSIEVIPYSEKVNRHFRAWASLTLIFDQES
jgi:hypothetical protein